MAPTNQSLEARVWLTPSPSHGERLPGPLSRLLGSAVDAGQRVLVAAQDSVGTPHLRAICEAVLAVAGPTGEVIVAGRGREVATWPAEFAAQGLWLTTSELGNASSPFAPAQVSLGTAALNRIDCSSGGATVAPEYRIAGEALAADCVLSLSTGSPLLNLAGAVQLGTRPGNQAWLSALDLNRILRHAGRRGELDGTTGLPSRSVAAVVIRNHEWLGGANPLAVETAARSLGWWNGRLLPLAPAFGLAGFPLSRFGGPDAVEVVHSAEEEAPAAA